ncbi:MAG: hypothetical protein K1X28_06985 [Parachlamydiales bacterium]|nr:hypothetical protein [Parachlamydiales bacterium]
MAACAPQRAIEGISGFEPIRQVDEERVLGWINVPELHSKVLARVSQFPHGYAIEYVCPSEASDSGLKSLRTVPGLFFWSTVRQVKPHPDSEPYRSLDTSHTPGSERAFWYPESAFAGDELRDAEALYKDHPTVPTVFIDQKIPPVQFENRDRIKSWHDAKLTEEQMSFIVDRLGEDIYRMAGSWLRQKLAVSEMTEAEIDEKVRLFLCRKTIQLLDSSDTVDVRDILDEIASLRRDERNEWGLELQPLEPAAEDLSAPTEFLPPVLPRTVLGSLTETPFKKRLMVGNQKVFQWLSASGREIASYFPVPLEVGLDPSTHWGRDSRILLESGQYLIPYGLKLDPELDKKMRCMLGETSESMSGQGFSRVNLAAARHQARKAKIPIKPNTKSVIEGGNCKLFRGPDGAPRALIGYCSVLLTLLALEKTKTYQTPEYLQFLIEYTSNHPEPKPESIQIANELYPDAADPIRSALEFEAKREYAKRIIAQELEIPLENIAFIHQSDFHIDLECFVSPCGRIVFLDDPKTALKMLENIADDDLAYQAVSFIPHAESEMRKAELVEKNRQMLEGMGYKVVLIAGEFQGRRRRMNFMNGVCIGDTFMTNGTSNCPLSAYFKWQFERCVKERCPNMKVLFVADDTDILEERLRANGGFHCMTWEEAMET